MADKKVATDFPIQKLLSDRWSPYSFETRMVSREDLCSLFEAARWAPSSSNEQPWSYIVATRENPAEFDRVLSCLVDANQVWAKNAPVLALGIVSRKFGRDNEDNRSAVHDLGLAAGNLCVEATARGISVHQMAGILPDKAREVFQIPANVDAWTALAIGYAAGPEKLPEKLKERDAARRGRKPLSQFVFTGKWGTASPLVQK